MKKKHVNTAPLVAIYFMFFFTLGTTACTSTKVYRIDRGQFERLSAQSGLQSRPITTLNAKEIVVTEQETIKVKQANLYKALVPFNFETNNDIITPSEETKPRWVSNWKHFTPFTLNSTDRFEIHQENFSLGKTLLTTAVVGVILTVVLFGSTGCVHDCEN